METLLLFVPVTIIIVLTIIPSIRLLRRTGLHVALAALNIVPFYGTVVLIWIIAHSNWPNTQAAKSVAPIVFSSPTHEKEGAARPKTIVYFEWIIFGTLLLGVLQGYLTWDRIVQPTKLDPDHSFSVSTLLTIFIFGFVLFGVLTLLVSRRRSKIAMWVLIAMFVIGLPALVQQITREQDIITAIVGIGQVLAYGLLFTPSARRWMNREDEKDEKLRDVFH